MCALFGELFARERVSEYKMVYTPRQARELGVFSFVAGILSCTPLLCWGLVVSPRYLHKVLGCRQIVVCRPKALWFSLWGGQRG